MKKRTNALLFFIASSILLIPLMGFETTMRDPTEPPNYINNTGAVTNPGQLTAVFIYPHYRIAIIGNQTVTLGGHFGEYTVTNISPYTVELTRPDSTKEILQLTVPVKQRSKER